MGGEIISFSAMSLSRARVVAENHELYSAADIVPACKMLFELGSADDRRTVMALQRAGIVAGFEDREATARAHKAVRRRKHGAAVLAWIMLFLMAVGAVVVASWLLELARGVLS